MAQPTKVRNYALDLFRVIAAILMIANHWIWRSGFPNAIDNGYWGAYRFTQMHDIASTIGIQNWDWFKGAYTMGFFVFVSGYFIMDGFKKAQARGAFNDPSTHFTHTWRYTAKTYCSYAPLCLFGWTFGWIISNVLKGSSIYDWFNTLVWNIFGFLGLHGIGMYQSNAVAPVDNYFGPAWYIEAIIVGACIFYALLIHDERKTVFIVLPLLFMSANIWLNQWLTPEGAQVEYGITTLLPQDLVRLWGPMSLGIWAWYLANAIRKATLTRTQENVLGVVWLAVLVYCLITSWTGYLGGMMQQDILWMFLALVVICQKDPITRGFNAALQKFPLSKYFADFSAGLFVVHWQIVINFQDMMTEKFGWNQANLVFILAASACAVLYIVVNKLVLKPMYGKLAKALHVGAPVKPQVFGGQTN